MVRKSEKKDLLYLHAKTKEKVHKVVKRPGRPFTLRDHIMTLHTEKMLLKKKHSLSSFMLAGIVLVALGLVLIMFFTDNVLYELLGWAAIIIGFAEILESWHRMERWKKGFRKK